MTPKLDLSQLISKKMKPGRDEEEHAILSPSKIEQTMLCLASLIPPVKQRIRNSKYADEGTLAADVFERAMRHGDSVFKDDTIPAYIREDMREMKRVVMKIIKKIGIKNIYKIILEERVHFSENIHGTPDIAILYLKDGKRRAYVIDGKYGKGKAVVAERNAQLMTYLSAMCKQHEWDIDQATLAIYQPRNQDECETDLDQWVVTSKDFRLWNVKLGRHEKAALKVIQGTVKPKEVYGEKQCFWCPRQLDCTAYRKAATMDGLLALEKADPIPVPAVVKKGEVVGHKVKQLTDTQIAQVVLNADIARSFIKECERYAAALYFTPKPIPGLKMVAGRKGKRKWIAPEKKIIDWASKLDITRHRLFESPKLMSPAQIEKLLPKNAKLPKKFIDQPPAKPKLVPDTDPRPALDNTSDAMNLLTALDEDTNQADE